MGMGRDAEQCDCECACRYDCTFI